MIGSMEMGRKPFKMKYIYSKEPFKMRNIYNLNYITKLQNSSAISGSSSPPYEVIPVLKEPGAALHCVVGEGQVAGADQQDGVQLTLAPRAQLLLLHAVRQREQQQHS